MRFRIIALGLAAFAVLVVWYTPAFTLVPHVEDYPVMTTESAHFHIEPDGFFDSNPALDAPGP